MKSSQTAGTGDHELDCKNQHARIYDCVRPNTQVVFLIP
jgi:hypothetical protein